MKLITSKRLLGFYVMVLLAAERAPGQTLVDLRTQSKSVDFSRVPSTSPVQTGGTLPETCPVGAMFFLTSAPAGANLYACVATNIWNVETGGAVTSGPGAPTGSCRAGAAYNDTVNGNTWFCENESWQKALTTNNTGGFAMTGQNGDKPAAPVTGQSSLFFSSTGRVAQSVDDTGDTATMIRPADCSRNGQMMQKVNADGTVSCASMTIIRGIGYTFDGVGQPLTSGVTKYLTVPFACTISAWNIAVDSGSATIRIWKSPTGTVVPSVSGSISTNGLSISSGTAIHSTALSDFTSTAIAANDILGFNLNSVVGATYLNFMLECKQ